MNSDVVAVKTIIKMSLEKGNTPDVVGRKVSLFSKWVANLHEMIGSRIRIAKKEKFCLISFCTILDQ